MLHERTINLKAFEEEIYRTVCLLGSEILSAALECWDKDLHENRDRAVYRDKGTRKTVLKTLMGEVEYSRHVYAFADGNGKKGYVYLLDNAIGKADSGFFSEALLERISVTVCELPYRKASEAISGLTGQSISHTAVWNATQQLGARIEELEDENAKKARHNKGEGEIEAKLLFEEQDGIYLHLQGADRDERGRSCEMKLAIAYDGAEKKGKDRFRLTNKVACANFEGIERFYRRKEGVIAANYNVDEIDIRILSGDGAGWIKRSAEPDVIYQLDVFHRNRAIRRATQDEDAMAYMLELLYSKQIDGLLEYIKTLESAAGNEKEKENLKVLHDYFFNNKEGLITYDRRGLNLPDPPEEKEYRRLGAMESNIFTIIGNRMKGRRKCWSVNGGNNLARLLCLKATGKLHGVITALSSRLPEKYAEEVITMLSSAKSKESVGKGYNGFDKATLPTEQKWLKAIAGFKSFSELSF
jgi:hypothetical protein